MSLTLGMDTGGTYTDAVLIRDETEVVASAKALTTREDLAIGIGEAVRAVLQEASAAPQEVTLAALSTTLATNALVEGQGERVGLIYIGFRSPDLEAQGLAAALKGDPFLLCAGGHDHSGTEAQPLDEAAIIDFLNTHGDQVSGFAVAAHFATRNPAHELRAAALVTDMTGCPVSASHELSARLNGPKRAVTAVLNARLIGMIDRLIGRTGDVLMAEGVNVPMMVVRGDGALISSKQARAHPIETILSGPAASIVGARWLTGTTTGFVSDIGGTTTDIALLKDGLPVIDPAGARVGPHRTMVEAVAMRTTGLGGDSAVHVEQTGLKGGLTLGPRRVLPVSLLAMEAPDVVHAALDAQLRMSVPGEHDAQFVRALAGAGRAGLSVRESALLDRIGADVRPLAEALRTRTDRGALDRLRDRGLVQVAGVTASDASHVLGKQATWDAGAAQKCLTLLARKRTGSGKAIAADAREMALKIVQQLTDQTAAALLEAAFAEEHAHFDGPPQDLARHSLMQRGLSDHRGLVRVSAGLNVPVVGLGASARSYYPAVGDTLNTEMILPENGGVANAIGAVVGRIIMRRSGTVTSPGEGTYRVHLPQGPQDFMDETMALAHLETALRELTRTLASQAGADDIQVVVSQDIRRASVEARNVFVEAVVTAEASGRPRVAASATGSRNVSV